MHPICIRISLTISTPPYRAAILFIIEDVTYNICDQKFHEFEIRRQNPDVFVLRKTLTEVTERGSLDEKTRKLFVEGIEVAMVYFRCGYSPDQGLFRQIGQL